jgi:membrane-bound serine protease (ClpP class)
VLIIVGLLAMLIPNAPDQFPWPDTPIAWDMFSRSLMSLCLGFIGFMVVAAILSRFLPKWSLIQRCRLILAPATAAADAPRPETSPMLKVHAGDTGTTETPLHPVGRVRFGDNLLDAVSEGEMIDQGKTVRVLRRDGNRIVVEEVTE